MCFRRVISFVLIFSIVTALFSTKTVYSRNGISAKSYIVMDAKSGKIILAGNENNQMPIASTTKIMTSLIALEQPDLYEKFEVQKKEIMVEGTSMGLREKDKVNLYDLTKGMLMASGNDAANVAATKIGGSVEGFLKIMNEKAKSIGMTNTNFDTPSGLDTNNHYSTARDMAVLAMNAINNEDFLNICSKQKTTTKFGNPPKEITFYNHNRLLRDYEGCIGVKTGFTKKSGRCLVSAAERNGVTLVCVTLSASNDWNDHKLLLDYGFLNVKPRELTNDNFNLQANVVGGDKDKIDLKLCGTLPLTLDENEIKNIKQEVQLNKFYYAPIKKDEILGKVVYNYNGIKLGEQYVSSNEEINYKR